MGNNGVEKGRNGVAPGDFLQVKLVDPAVPGPDADLLGEKWMQDGNCREVDTNTFFPSDGVGVETARKICATCPVKEPCLEFALFNGIDHGVWGGASERERRRIARRRRLKRAAASAGIPPRTQRQ